MTRPTAIAFALLALLAAPAAAQHSGHAGHAAGGHGAGLDALDPDTRAAAERQLDQVRAATARYQDHDNAVADGYERFEPGPGDPLMGEHWFRADRVRDELDLTRPSTLIYASIGGERRLIAVAYTLYQRPGLPLPEGFAGDADRWHVHDVAELADIVLAERPVVRWFVKNRLARRSGGRTDLVMLHAWIGMDNPDGVFANQNVALPYVRAGLPIAWAYGGQPAARGVALLEPGTCGNHVKAMDRMADLNDRQKAAVESACEAAAVRVATARVRSAGSAPLNEEAARAWLDYTKSVSGILTGDQEERLAALRSATTH